MSWNDSVFNVAKNDSTGALSHGSPFRLILATPSKSRKVDLHAPEQVHVLEQVIYG